MDDSKKNKTSKDNPILVNRRTYIHKLAIGPYAEIRRYFGNFQVEDLSFLYQEDVVKESASPRHAFLLTAFFTYVLNGLYESLYKDKKEESPPITCVGLKYSDVMKKSWFVRKLISEVGFTLDEPYQPEIHGSAQQYRLIRKMKRQEKQEKMRTHKIEKQAQ